MEYPYEKQLVQRFQEEFQYFDYESWQLVQLDTINYFNLFRRRGLYQQDSVNCVPAQVAAVVLLDNVLRTRATQPAVLAWQEHRVLRLDEADQALLVLSGYRLVLWNRHYLIHILYRLRPSLLLLILLLLSFLLLLLSQLLLLFFLLPLFLNLLVILHLRNIEIRWRYFH